jgi:hypothetical protein
MLLHNLYWLVSPVPTENIVYVQDLSNMNGTDFAVARNEITCSTSVDLTDFIVEITAGNRIRLNQGFKVTPGAGTFKADVSETGPMGEAIRYRKLPITNYPCNPVIGFPKSAKGEKLISETAPWFSYYPNPAKDYMIIEATRKIKAIEIYNLSGARVELFTPLSDNYTINTSLLQKGIYICKISDMNDNFKNFKIIIQ